MVHRSNSSWSLSPETIMNHHYRLTKGIKPVVDTSPPYSMYNSPISVHYIPKRASSADAAKRNLARLPRPQRELAEFVASHSLKLPLHLTSSRNDLTKPKLLENRNYQPPTRKKKIDSKPPKPTQPLPPQYAQAEERQLPPQRNHPKVDGIDLFNMFKDSVYTSIIDRDVFSDSLIVDTVETEMERWIGRISWDNLEYLKEQIYSELGISNGAQPKKESRSPNSLGNSSPSTSSSSSASHSSRRSRSKSSRSSASSSSSHASSSASESASSSSRQSDATEDDELSSIE